MSHITVGYFTAKPVGKRRKADDAVRQCGRDWRCKQIGRQRTGGLDSPPCLRARVSFDFDKKFFPCFSSLSPAEISSINIDNLSSVHSIFPKLGCTGRIVTGSRVPRPATRRRKKRTQRLRAQLTSTQIAKTGRTSSRE